MRTKLIAAVMFAILVPASLVLAQKTNDVHLFQNFFRDAVIASTPYGEAGLSYGSYDGGSNMTVGAQGGYPVNEKLEIGVGVHYLNFSADGADSQGGLADPIIAARYLLKPGPTQFSAGGYATLPVGSEDIGQGTLDFGVYGALRHQLDAMTLTGTIGLDFVEVKTFDFNTETFELEEKTEHKSSLVIGGGAIYPLDKALNIVGELVMKTEVDYMMLSGGVDYLMGNGRLRGGLGLGLDDGAPDLLIMASYLMSF